MLYSLKFHHPRPRALAMVFLNILESTYLALLVSDQIAPLYHYMFGFLLSNELPSLSVLAVLTTCNVFIACLMALIVLVEVKCLSRLAGAVNQFLKSFVYVPFVPLMVYLMNVFTIPSDILTKVLGLFSMLFLALFALIH